MAALNTTGDGAGERDRSMPAASGEAQTPAALLGPVYDELRAMAHNLFRGEPPQTLQPTALVHEAYNKLAAGGQVYRNEAHFLAVAATAMRQILVDRARGRGRTKRGGAENANRGLGCGGAAAERAAVPAEITIDELLALDEALVQLEALDERKARVVELRFFAGMSVDQVAEAMELSPTTVKGDWRFARAWLGARLAGERDTQGPGEQG